MKPRITKESALAELATMGLGTREAAAAALVDLEVAKWGEGERAGAVAAIRGKSHGAMLNTLAVRAAAAPNRRLMALARVLLTAGDRAAMSDAARDS